MVKQFLVKHKFLGRYHHSGGTYIADRGLILVLISIVGFALSPIWLPAVFISIRDLPNPKDAMNPVIHWTLIILAVVGIVAAAILTFIVIGHWLSPRLDRMSKGIKPMKGWNPCCPAGLGCNDPDQQYNKCLRTEARRIGTVEELLILDQAWSAYSAVPTKKKKEKKAAHYRYNAARDSIVARALRDASERLDSARRLELPAHIAESKSVKGQVMSDKDQSTSRWGI